MQGSFENSLASEVLKFWFGEGAEYGKTHKRWFEKDPTFDAEVGRHFSHVYEEQMESRDWLATPRECLARIVVLDQFPRHIHRGTARAFSSDPPAVETAKRLLALGWDRDMLPVERMFAYLPLQHSESLDDQERSCSLYEALKNFPETADSYRYALAHRAIIVRFGRFPHRNAVLGRPSTREEIEFLREPGSSF